MASTLLDGKMAVTTPKRNGTLFNLPKSSVQGKVPADIESAPFSPMSGVKGEVGVTCSSQILEHWFVQTGRTDPLVEDEILPFVEKALIASSAALQ